MDHPTMDLYWLDKDLESYYKFAATPWNRVSWRYRNTMLWVFRFEDAGFPQSDIDAAKDAAYQGIKDEEGVYAGL